MNPYEILELPAGSSAEDIKAAYHRLAKKWHPDRFTGPEKEEAERRFRQLAEAFNMLKDAGRREDLNKHLAATPTPSEPVIQLQQERVPPTVPLNERTASDWYEEAKRAIRINPKDVDSTIRLAEVFQTVGMYARATKLWETARYLAPNHRYFVEEQKKASAKAKAAEQLQGMGEQFAVLKEQGKTLINRWLKRG